MQEQPGVGGNKVSMGHGKLRGFYMNIHLNSHQAALLPFKSGFLKPKIDYIIYKEILYHIHVPISIKGQGCYFLNSAARNDLALGDE